MESVPSKDMPSYSKLDIIAGHFNGLNTSGKTKTAIKSDFTDCIIKLLDLMKM